jgi:hypothetical protein
MANNEYGQVRGSKNGSLNKDDNNNISPYKVSQKMGTNVYLENPSISIGLKNQKPGRSKRNPSKDERDDRGAQGPSQGLPSLTQQTHGISMT